jgi:hypothetical protein
VADVAGPGRPKGTKNAVKTDRPNKINRDKETSAPIFKCSCCQKEFPSQSGNFYYTKSFFYKGNGNYSTICVACIQNNFKELENSTGSTRVALIVICHLLDTHYSEKIFNNMVSQDTFNLGMYLNSFNGRQWAGKTFSTNLLQNDFAKAIEFDDDNIPVKESPDDIKNKTYCLSQLGHYDPFVDNVPAVRVFLFNILAGYLTEDIVEDPHRLQTVVSIAKSILQEAKIDKLIDKELKNTVPDNALIKTYTESKSKIRGLINDTANENGLSVKSSGRSTKGANTLTGIMRDMIENNFEDIKVNVVDVKMSNVFKDIADISNKSLFEQLNNQPDDYARMVADQRIIIQDLEREKMLLQEELRNAKSEIKKIKMDDGNTE